MNQTSAENKDKLEVPSNDSNQSIQTLLNLLPDPAIIYQPNTNKIIAGNNPLFLLTNLGENDFINQPIKALLHDISDTNPISGHNKSANLRHKKLPPIPVNVKIYSLSPDKDKLLFTLHPEDIHKGSSHSLTDLNSFLNQLSNLIETPVKQGAEINVKNILEKTAKLLNADWVGIYQAGGNLPQLLHYLSNNKISEIFPQVLDKLELINHQTSTTWIAQSPPSTLLQKTAAQNNFKFLITYPLGNKTNKFGLLVVGGKATPLPSEAVSLTKFIAVHLSNVLETNSSLRILRNTANKIKHVLKIQNELIANLEEGVMILAPDLTIAEINPAAESMLGFSNIEVLRQPIDTILIGSKSLRSALSSAQQGVATLTADDLMLHHRSGKSFPAQLMAAPVIDQSKLLSIVLLIRDTSQQAESQAANKQLEQRAILGEVTAIFAHEVRNPINAIMLSLQVMEDNIGEEDENIKWIENMRDECNKLMYLMDSVLSFAKPLEYRMTDVDLDYLLNQILQRWHPRLMRLNISSYYETEVDNPIIEGDLRALEQVFTNLISNSVNAMSDEGGSLSIRITVPENDSDKHFYKISLTDSGHGIPDEIKQHMFQPFVTGSQQGTGLGLAITQRIINAHKGKIEVESFTGGTIFTIFLKKKERAHI